MKGWKKPKEPVIKPPESYLDSEPPPPTYDPRYDWPYWDAYKKEQIG